MSATRPLTISLHALGGQGGGVLADWLIAVARDAGWLAQSTSVPGVAQRTGATVYYLELFPMADAAGRAPVLALAPTPGDVDLVIASELMEAGRAVNRGLVTERTTLVASSGRVYSIGEKSGMGDGRFADAPVLAGAREAAGRVVAFDMQALSHMSGSVISAILLGAVAASGALPFAREAYHAAIRASGIAVERNLAGFAAAFAAAEAALAGTAPLPAAAPSAATERLIAEGERRLRDYQDAAYARLYRERLARFAGSDDGDGLLLRELARYLALWMSYEDTARVADLKTRAARFERVRGEVGAGPDQPVRMVEYLHPRVEELCDTMPARLGAWASRTGWVRRLLRPFARGRHVDTASLRGFTMLYLIARLRRWRRGSLRYLQENAKIEGWLDRIAAARDPALAVEITRCQRLIKGYGETYDRGWTRFAAIMARVDGLDAAGVARLRAAALADEGGEAFARERLAA